MIAYLALDVGDWASTDLPALLAGFVATVGLCCVICAAALHWARKAL